MSAQIKMDSTTASEDFDFMLNEFRQNFLSWNRYMDDKQLKSEIADFKRKLSDVQSDVDFYQDLRAFLAKMGHGHLSLNFSDKTLSKLGASRSYFPLMVRLMNNHLVITQNYGDKNEQIQDGLSIVSINGVKIDSILAKLYPMVMIDGHIVSSKKAWIGGMNFSLLYRLAFGGASLFTMEVEEFGANEPHTVTIPAIRLKDFLFENKKLKSVVDESKKFKWKAINDSVAYVCVPSFRDRNLDYAEFYKSTFKSIDSMHIKYLIVDLQNNSLTEEGNENLLFGYLSSKTMHKYKQAMMLSRIYRKHLDNDLILSQRWATIDTIVYRGKNTLSTDYYSDYIYKKPQRRYIFGGHLYLLISGRTYAGAAEIASLMKHSKSATLVGEETGATFNGDMAGLMESFTLPNSKLVVKFPTTDFQLEVKPNKKGRGVLPDYDVSQTWSDYVQGKNSLEEFVLKLISKKK